MADTSTGSQAIGIDLGTSIGNSIEASIPACHAGDPGSIPGFRVNYNILLINFY